jgi:hypothetical protein
MAGEVFIDEGDSCSSAVDQGVSSNGLITKGKIAQNNKMLSFHYYLRD